MTITNKQALFDHNLKGVLEDFLIASDIEDLEVDTFKLNTSVEEDLRFPVNVLRIPAVNKIPEIVAFGLAFDKAAEEECYCLAQMPHSRDRTTDLYAHFHWQTKGNGAGNVVWGVTWQSASIGAAFSEAQTLTTTSASLTDSTKHIMSSEIVIPASTLGISGMVKLTIFRDATDDDDTYDDDAILLEFDIHYFVDKLGDSA